MSSSTESIYKGEEKEGNSKNNPKDEMPKVTSTMETNSKGARPKTSSTSEKSKKETKKEQPKVTSKMKSISNGTRLKTSSTSEKSKKETVEKKHFLKVLIMNASGDNQGEGTVARRKQIIIDVIKGHNPDLVLFQEFKWKKIRGKKWPSHSVLDHYRLIIGNDASILYNINELIVTESPIGELQRILEELQRPTSKHPTPIPKSFAPIPRMSLRVVKTKGVPVMEFICISWHGTHAGMSNNTKVTEFTHLMIFLNEIYAKIHLPLLIAGDFNVDIKLISREVKDPFKLYEYEASARREKKGVIDYFIASTELHLSDITPVDLKEVSKVNILIAYTPYLSYKPPVDLKKDSKADNPEDVLDHDPIIAMLELAHLSDTAPA